jgi:hypothetical protein
MAITRLRPSSTEVSASINLTSGFGLGPRCQRDWLLTELSHYTNYGVVGVIACGC